MSFPNTSTREAKPWTAFRKIYESSSCTDWRKMERIEGTRALLIWRPFVKAGVISCRRRRSPCARTGRMGSCKSFKAFWYISCELSSDSLFFLEVLVQSCKVLANLAVMRSLASRANGLRVDDPLRANGSSLEKMSLKIGWERAVSVSSAESVFSRDNVSWES